jgi:hypothetical protein
VTPGAPAGWSARQPLHRWHKASFPHAANNHSGKTGARHWDGTPRPDRQGRRYIDAVPLVWLDYRDPEGRSAGVVVLESSALIQARMKAAVLGLDPGLECEGHQLDEVGTTQILPLPELDRPSMAVHHDGRF